MKKKDMKERDIAQKETDETQKNGMATLIILDNTDQTSHTPQKT